MEEMTRYGKELRYENVYGKEKESKGTHFGPRKRLWDV